MIHRAFSKVKSLNLCKNTLNVMTAKRILHPTIGTLWFRSDSMPLINALSWPSNKTSFVKNGLKRPWEWKLLNKALTYISKMNKMHMDVSHTSRITFLSFQRLAVSSSVIIKETILLMWRLLMPSPFHKFVRMTYF